MHTSRKGGVKSHVTAQWLPPVADWLSPAPAACCSRSGSSGQGRPRNNRACSRRLHPSRPRSSARRCTSRTRPHTPGCRTSPGGGRRAGAHLGEREGQSVLREVNFITAAPANQRLPADPAVLLLLLPLTVSMMGTLRSHDLRSSKVDTHS